MTTLAIQRPLRGRNGERGVELLKYADIAVIAIALPVFIFAGLPLLGWTGAAIGWCGQRFMQYVLERKANQIEDAKGFFRVMAGSLIGRSWFLVLMIFAVGLIERPAGLAAALLSAATFTTYLVITLINRPATPTVEGQ